MDIYQFFQSLPFPEKQRVAILCFCVNMLFQYEHILPNRLTMRLIVVSTCLYYAFKLNTHFRQQGKITYQKIGVIVCTSLVPYSGIGDIYITIIFILIIGLSVVDRSQVRLIVLQIYIVVYFDQTIYITHLVMFALTFYLPNQ